MISFAVSGALGRMGSRIITLGIQEEGFVLKGALEKRGHEFIGKDIGLLLGLKETGVFLTDEPQNAIKEAEVLIEFSTPSVTLEHLRLAVELKKAMVIGTTGFSKQELEELRSLAVKIPCVVAPNMSVGVNLLLKVLRDVAVVLGDEYDVEIIEAHHRLKKDAPSGTAMKMAQVIADALGRNIEEVAVYERKGMIGERSKKEIGIQTVRAGDIVGEHTVLFGGIGERIEITHRASSRDTFAKGALRAARWLVSKSPGLYDMQDVLGLR
ncbi:MAG: 4-hydroxy-tetrahydrodipicolinate reductase [Thermodesulfovibrionales bacterium]|nr:4-hydroxy-tetrahydrodipicolinate reductase [Thermodesulfovibrionales bacterium]